MRSLKIAGEERLLDLKKKSLKIKKALTYEIDTCSFQLDGDQPNEGDEVIIEDGERLFAGVIVKVQLDKSYPQNLTRANTWSLDCDDYTVLLDKRLVVETYENMSASDIFLDIAAKYCPGFTTNGVHSGAPVVEYIPFDYIRPSECFKQLCDYIGWHWQPDYYKDLQLFSAEELASPAPLELVPGGPFRFGKHSIDTQGLRNRVYVRGGTMLSDSQTIEWKADGVARTWVLPWKPHEVSLSVGEVPMSVGLENINVDDENDFGYIMNFQEKYIRCSSGTPTPVAGTTMSLTARQDIDVITMVEDLESQAAIAAVQGGDGVYEHVIPDDSLTTIEAAEAAGMADLREHANPRVSGSFETETPGWQPGQLVNINLPDRGVDGTFLVQNVGIQPIAAEWIYTVQYGGRLLGIADFLKALVSAQQKKKLNDTAILHKFTYGQEKVEVSDQLTITPKEPPWVVEQGYEKKHDIAIPGDTLSFSRASTAYKEDNTVVASGEPRYENGEVLVEGTTNLLTANQSDVEENTTGFLSQYSAIISRSTEEAWHGDASLKVITPGVLGDEGMYMVSTDVIPSEWYAASFRVKGEGTITALFTERNSSDGYITGISKTVQLTEEWQWVTGLALKFSALGVKARLWVRTPTSSPQAITYYVDAIQLERKDHATEFVVGTRDYVYNGKAIRIEEGTTNIIPIEKQTFTVASGWYAYSGGVATITQNQIVPEWNTETATRIQVTGGTSTLKYFATLLAPSVNGVAYSNQVLVKNIGTKDVIISANMAGPLPVTVAPGETSHVKMENMIGNGVNHLQLRFSTPLVEDTVDIIAYRPMSETKPYCTSFIEGTREVEFATVPSTGILSASQGTIRLKMHPNIYKYGGVVYTDGTTQKCFWVGINTNGTISFKTGNGTITIDTASNTVLSKDQFTLITATWKNQIAKLYVNGVKEKESAPFSFGMDVGSDIKIGVASTLFCGNFNLGELAFDNDCLLDEQIAADIQAGTLQQLPTTTALFDFEDTLAGDVQALSPVITAIGSKARIQHPESTAWPGLQIASRPEGGEWGEFMDVDPSRANEVDCPGEFIVKADQDCKALVKNWKKPFDETDVVCGFAECASK